MKFLGNITRKLGLNRGIPRLWLEGALPARAGFTPGARYNLAIDGQQKRVTLSIDERGLRMVSKKEKDGQALPIIDINSKEWLSIFDGMNAVRIVLQEGAIHILPLAVEVKKQERIERLKSAMTKGEITVGSISHGGGILSHAFHTGLKAAGLKPKLLWACEIREEVIEHACVANEAWSKDTIALAMPMQELAFADEYTLGKLEKPILLESGLPCVAASLSGRAKKGLAMPEHDETAGHLVAAAIALIARLNPVAYTLENVEPYFNTASYSILCTQLKELGYTLQEVELPGENWALEARPRRMLLAMTEGVEVDLAQLVPTPKPYQTVGEILDPIAQDDPMWKTYDYLESKAVRDKEAGKGFARQLIEPHSRRVGTIGTGYNKARSTEPFLVHPVDKSLSRLFTPQEHARLKGIPPELIKGITSKTLAHEILGASIIWPAFRDIAELIGHYLNRWASQLRISSDVYAAA